MKDRILWCISKWLLLPSSWQKKKGLFFFNIHCAHLEVKLTKLHPIDWVPLEFLTQRLLHTEPSAIVIYSSSFPTLALVPITFSTGGFMLYKLWLSVFFINLSSFRDSGFPYDITSLTDLWRIVDFPVFLAFYLLRWLVTLS